MLVFWLLVCHLFSLSSENTRSLSRNHFLPLLDVLEQRAWGQQASLALGKEAVLETPTVESESGSSPFLHMGDLANTKSLAKKSWKWLSGGNLTSQWLPDTERKVKKRKASKGSEKDAQFTHNPPAPLLPYPFLLSMLWRNISHMHML